MAASIIEVETDSWDSDNTNVGTLDFTLSSAPDDGDLLLFISLCAVGAGWDIVVPSGWDELENLYTSEGNHACTYQIMYRFASSDGTGYTFNQTNQYHGSIGVFIRASGIANPIDEINTSIVHSSSNTNITSPGLTVSEDGSLILRAVRDKWLDGTFNGPPSGYTRIAPPTSNVGGRMVVDYGEADAGALGSEIYSHNTGWHADWYALTIAIAPEASGVNPKFARYYFMQC